MARTLRLGESRIPELCRRAGISQSELARHIGVPRQTIYKVNKGERELSLVQAINIADRLGCKVEDLHVIIEGNRNE